MLQCLMGSPCSTGHRQKIEDQTKAFPDRFGDLRMRVTPGTPSPRSSLNTTSHFSSQAQTPIQGMELCGDQAELWKGSQDVVHLPLAKSLGKIAPHCFSVDSWGSLQFVPPGRLVHSAWPWDEHEMR